MRAVRSIDRILYFDTINLELTIESQNVNPILDHILRELETIPGT